MYFSKYLLQTKALPRREMRQIRA